MTKSGPLIAVCKTNSGKPIRIGAAEDWTALTNDYGAIDFVEMYCVLEVRELELDRGEKCSEFYLNCLNESIQCVSQHFHVHPEIQSLFPDSLERARIGRALLEKARVGG